MEKPTEFKDLPKELLLEILTLKSEKCEVDDVVLKFYNEGFEVDGLAITDTQFLSGDELWNKVLELAKSDTEDFVEIRISILLTICFTKGFITIKVGFFGPHSNMNKVIHPRFRNLIIIWLENCRKKAKEQSRDFTGSIGPMGPTGATGAVGPVGPVIYGATGCAGSYGSIGPSPSDSEKSS